MPPGLKLGAILMAGTPQPNTPTTMGKQISVLRIKGSVGEVTGYNMNTSSKTSKRGDFIRSKATSVANPRSYAQAKQRAKARPAQIFYEAFSNVENHAFFPLDKAIKNRNMFLSLAMKLGYVPDVKKGEAKIPFAPYQVSKGALGLSSLCVGSHINSDDSAIAFESLEFEYVFDEKATIAAFSSSLLDANILLAEGMELTFLAVCCNPNNPDERWAQIASVVLDTTDNVTTLEDVLGKQLKVISQSLDTDCVVMTTADVDMAKILAGALIISSKTENSWQYTNSYMALTAYAIDGFDWKEREIIESYMNETRDRNSDKQLQQADNAHAGEMVPIVSVGNAEITKAQGVTGTPNPTDAAIAQTRFGISKVVVSDSGQLQWYNGPAKTWTPVFLDSQDDRKPLVLADTTWAGSQTITVAECQAAGF